MTVDGDELRWTVQGAELRYAAGRGRAADHPPRRAGSARPAALSDAATVEITDGYLADRMGWREITAAGEGVAAGRSDVPVASVSQELRTYPADLLADPLDVRAATSRCGRAPAPAAAAGPRLPTASAGRAACSAG